ncbi:MAG: anaerobic ribonucleoside-triphosphate reductase activating protein [Lachnospiraceae bacterium]|nr:anaerobic ribonucleoside-triphosphate reductase activating protein [Lachnospiraceae bacterium]
MYYSAIKYCDIANGPGVRTVLFVSGCRNRCKGCFQPETWDFWHGEPFDGAAEKKILESLKPDYISGLTLLGGDPFEPENQRALLPFVKKVRAQYPSKSIWAYTGYILERDLMAGGCRNTEVTEELLSCLDVLVDGPFIEEQKNISLRFRGSQNQRIIDLHEGVTSAAADGK